jgi:predicted ATP-grasp superfamily ATP-dependent carboligase
VGGDYQGLGIVRSLGRRKVPVCVIDDEFSIARFSRYATHSVRVPSLRDAEGTVELVLETGRRLGLLGWVLYPTRDETVAAFARNRERLAAFYRVPTMGWETVQWLWDKRNTYRLADKLGVPIPTTWYPRSAEELATIAAAVPVAVKPAIKEHFIYATKAKAWRADSPETLREMFRKAANLIGPEEVIVQDLIPGDGRQQYAYCAFFKHDRAVGSMVVRRRRQHPPEFGRSSTFVETVEVPELHELAERFLRAINYYGLVEVEFKLDPRDNTFRLLDVNGRTWGYHSLGASAGVDFSHLLYADQIGQPVEDCRGRAGVSWVRLLTDVPTAVVEIAGGRQKASEYLRTLVKHDVEAVFSRNDYLPGLVELLLVPYLSYKRGF